jgi:hypothetical protein
VVVVFVGVVVSVWWSSVPVNVVVAGGCYCGCGVCFGGVICVGDVDGGVAGVRGFGVAGSGVAGGVCIVVGRRLGGGGVGGMVVIGVGVV